MAELSGLLDWLGDDAPSAVVDLATYVREVWRREGRTPESYLVSAQEANDICNYWVELPGSWNIPAELTTRPHDGTVARYRDTEAGGGDVKIVVRELVGVI